MIGGDSDLVYDVYYVAGDFYYCNNNGKLLNDYYYNSMEFYRYRYRGMKLSETPPEEYLVDIQTFNEPVIHWHVSKDCSLVVDVPILSESAIPKYLTSEQAYQKIAQYISMNFK